MVQGLARDEMLDAAGRLRPPWRRMLGTLLGLGTAALRERTADLDRAFAEEGVAALLPGRDAGQWRCDPIPMLFTQAEFGALAAALIQRARLLELVLADLYGAQVLLAEGMLPPALVLGSPLFLRPCRAEAGVAPPRQLHLYAAELLRRPDGRWCVLGDRTAEPSGLAYALENRRMMSRVLPELFRSLEVSPLRPFFDFWQDALQRLAPAGGRNPGLALLSPGHGDPRWFEHVVLARELSCALVEQGDLTVREGALFLKTLKGLEPVHVLLRRQEGRLVDPLELPGEASAGIPGLLSVARAGAVRILNAPGAALAEAPGLAAFLPLLAERLLGEKLELPSVETVWLGDPVLRDRVMRELPAWILRSALDGAAVPLKPAGAARAGETELLDRIAERPWAYAAVAATPPSFAPCVGAGEVLDPRSVVLRMFLVHDGDDWRALPGGLARVLSPDDAMTGRLPQAALSKDVWVLQEEGEDIVGPGNLAVPDVPIRRMAGDLPSRVADNFFWLGRYLERLENGARLVRALLARIGRASLLPRETPEIAMLVTCLAQAGVVARETPPGAGSAMLAEMLVRALSRDAGGLARQISRLGGLADLLRDRLSGDMHATMVHGLRRLTIARQALRPGRQAAAVEKLSDLALQVLDFAATVAGYAAENMVRGGGRLFLDLGRRVERAQAVAAQLALALERPPSQIESGLRLALELCDSVITYRGRYLTALQPAPVLDLVIADEGNPRGLAYQLTTARAILAVLGSEDPAPLAGLLDGAIAECAAMIRELERAEDPLEIAAALPDRLRGIEAQAASLSNAVTRQYFALLPVSWTDMALPEPVP